LNVPNLLTSWMKLNFGLEIGKASGHSFWLQTSTDKFYPDFVCKLKDGRVVVVEYKAATCGMRNQREESLGEYGGKKRREMPLCHAD